MRKACLFLAAMLMVMPTIVLAGTEQVIGVSVGVEDSGVNLPVDPVTGEPVIFRCLGTLPVTANPWEDCTRSSGISFGSLTSTLVGGADAGCFYAPDYFVVYLFPDAWGGVGYQIDQTFAWTTPGIPDESLVFTAVYSPEDKYAGGDRQDTMPPGALLGPADGNPHQAVGGPYLVYKSDPTNKLVIVRAQYGLPPNPATGDPKPFDTWVPVPKSTPVGTYSGQLTITISPT